MAAILKLKTVLTISGVIAGLAVGGYGLHQVQAADVETTVSTAAPQAMPVATTRIAQEPVRLWSDFSGRLSAVEEVQLRPQVSGAIVDVRFEDGQMVRNGDVLFVIDPRRYQAAVDQARADVSVARQTLDLARKEKARAETLVDKGTVSKRVFDERENAYKVALSQVNAARARLEQAEIELDHAYVKAPIDGRVSRVEITIGNHVVAGSSAPVLTTIVSNDAIYADFDIDEQTYLATVFGGAEGDAHKVPVELTVGSGQSIAGYVHSFDNRIDPQTGTIRTRALFDNKTGALLPGMFAKLRLGTPAKEDLILLSPEAISTDQDRKFVYVVSDDNTVEYRQVTLGAQVNDKRVVTSGLKAGDQVIVNGIMKLRPGMPVAPQLAQASTS